MILFKGNFSNKTTCAITITEKDICLSGTACQSQKNYKGYNLLECTSVFKRSEYRGLLLSFCPNGLISNSPYCLPHDSYDVSLENFVLDQPRIPYRYLFLFSSLVRLILWGEILFLSPVGVDGLFVLEPNILLRNFWVWMAHFNDVFGKIR